MTRSLEQQVRTVARRASRLARWYGLGSFIAIVGLFAMIAGLLDYFFRYQQPGLVWFASCIVWMVAAVCSYRYLYRQWRYACSDLHAAHCIERRFPELADRVSSAVAFAREPADDALAGSVQLRRAVVTEVSAALQQVDVTRCLSYRASRRALIAAAVPLLVVLVFLAIDARSTRLAAARLLAPWSAPGWPRRHVLQFVQPTRRVARGQDYQVELVDRNGKLPNDVQIECWPDGEDKAQVEPSSMQADRSILIYRRANVTCGFRIRARGGDDHDMPWLHVAVVTPPKVARFNLTLHPPAYAGLPERRAMRRFQALEGTCATFLARTDKRLSAARLETNTTDPALNLALRLEADKRGFSLTLQEPGTNAWTVTRTGTFAVRLIDESGLDAGAVIRGDVQVVRDAAPTVTLVQPDADLSVTAQARIRVVVVGQDDLAVRMLRLWHRAIAGSKQADWVPVELWSGPPRLPPPNTTDSVVGGTEDRSTRTVEYPWDLANIADLRIGQVVEFHATASDYKPQQSESATRRLTIIAVEQLLADISAAQSSILRRIADVVQLQRQIRRRTRSLETESRSVGQLGQSDVDQLQSVEVNQRQVRQQLVDPADSVHVQITRLVDQLNYNRVDRPEMLRRLLHLDHVIMNLDRQSLGVIQNDLVDTLTAAQDALAAGDSESASQKPVKTADPTRDIPDSPAVGPRDVPRVVTPATDIEALLQRVGQSQDLVIDDLERLLREFSQWDSYQQIVRQLGQIRARQDTLRQSTIQLRARTLGRVRQELTLQQRADLRRAADQQSELSRDLDRWLGRVAQTRDQLRPMDPAIADVLSEAWNVADDLGVSTQMYDAGRSLETNQLGQTIEIQREILLQLARIQDILKNPRAERTKNLVRQLTEITDQIRVLEQTQDRVAESLSRSSSLTPSAMQQLGRQEAKLGDDADMLSQRLQELGQREARTTLERAAQALGQAKWSADSGRAESAARHAARAKENLMQTSRTLQAAVRAARLRLQAARHDALRQALDPIAVEQQDLLDRTSALEQRQSGQDTRDADTIQQIAALAERQERNQMHIDQLAAATAQDPAFDFALRRISRSMGEAHTLLRDRQTGAPTQRWQRRSLVALDQLRAALENDVKPAAEKPKPKPGESNKPKKGQGEDLQLLAQLRLVRMMQEDVNRETSQLRSAREFGTWDDELVRRQQTLIEYQGELADILSRLIPETGPPRGTRIESPMKDLQRAIKQPKSSSEPPRSNGPKRSADK